MFASHQATLASIARVIKKNSTFFIAGHLKPDGDTVGTALALASLLSRLKKKAFVYSKEPVPDYLKFLPGVRSITITEKVTRSFDCAIILECYNLERMGSLIDAVQAKTLINIDHHASFTKFGHINYINSAASSSAEQLFSLFDHFHLPLTTKEAICLYTGLVTDTGRFQHSNASPTAHRVAAALIEAGVKPEILYDKIYGTKSMPALKLLGNALSALTLDCSNRIAYFQITRSMYRRTSATPMDTEEIINYAVMVPGVVVGILFRENDEPGVIKVSFRSKGDINVSAIARQFDGGGHRNAAGCSIAGSIGAVTKKVIAHICKELK